MKLEHCLAPHRKINSKWTENLNVRSEITKLFKENTGRPFFKINHIKILYDPHPRVMEIKTKISKWEQIKLKSFCTAKETTNKMKGQPSEWDKITANEASDKGLTSNNIPATHAAQNQGKKFF